MTRIRSVSHCHAFSNALWLKIILAALLGFSNKISEVSGKLFCKLGSLSAFGQYLTKKKIVGLPGLCKLV